MKGNEKNKVIRYVPIGDSYTKGHGVSPSESWPAILTDHLNAKGVRMRLLANPSEPGWTTKQAIQLELPVFRNAKTDFSTLMIGVNDFVQGVDEGAFRKNFIFLLEEMGRFLPKNRLLAITIPDFSATPVGKEYCEVNSIKHGVSAFNKIIKEESKKRGIKLVDLFPVSQEMRRMPELVFSDGLHPSAIEYRIWEKIIYPVVYDMLCQKVY